MSGYTAKAAAAASDILLHALACLLTRGGRYPKFDTKYEYWLLQLRIRVLLEYLQGLIKSY